MKKTISLLLSIILVVALIIPTMAADVTSFSDVPTDHWGYSPIMAMVNMDILNGKTDPDANGVAQYDPDGNMTRSEFIKVIVAIYYKNEVDSMPASPEVWYANYYTVASKHGIVKGSEFSLADMNQNCSRQEMAMFMVRALENATGEKATNLVDTSVMSDYSSIGTYYQGYVRQAYSLGLLAGMGDGTFAPTQAMTRAQAATALYRLVDASTRVAVDTGTGTTTPGTGTTNPTPSTGAQQWVEGQSHNMPHKGDIVTKADGTQVVLDYGYGGVLGAGQGVDIYTGWNNPGGSTADSVNASGNRDMTTVKKDSITGEAHTRNEWVDIQREASPKTAGSYVGEVRNTWFTWDGAFWISSIPI